jgi:hypothetical protein
LKVHVVWNSSFPSIIQEYWKVLIFWTIWVTEKFIFFSQIDPDSPLWALTEMWYLPPRRQLPRSCLNPASKYYPNHATILPYCLF